MASPTLSLAAALAIQSAYQHIMRSIHIVAGSIFGVGAAKRLSAVRWQVAQNMVTAWVLTFPATAAVAAACYLGLTTLGMR